MDRQQIRLKLAIDHLGLSLKMDDFDNRLILQKAVYLAQAKQVHLGYYYQWYLYGPYCPSLTKDLYAIDSEGRYGVDECNRWELDEQSCHRLDEIKGLFTETAPGPLPSNLELLASVHFLVTCKQVSRSDAKQITEILKRYNKDFSPQEVEVALGELDKYGLLPG